MKTIFTSIVFLLLSCLTANAQNSDINPQVLYCSYNFGVANNIGITYAQADTAKSVVIGESYEENPAYLSGRNLRLAGIITTGAGTLWGLICGGLAIYGAHSDEFLDGLSGAVAGRLALFSIPAIGAGVTMWLCGQHRMKKVKAASSGIGLAYIF